MTKNTEEAAKSTTKDVEKEVDVKTKTENDEQAAEVPTVEELLLQVKDLESKQEQILRVLAEKENSLRRASADLDKERKYAVSKLLHELLAVVDSLEQGLKAAGDTEKPTAILEGVQLTLSMLQGILSKHGVQAVEPQQGDAFDPAFHEAMSQQEHAEVAAGKVLMLLQKGYILHDRLIRPALVIVAKAPALS